MFNSATKRCAKCLVGEYKDTEGNNGSCTTCPDGVTTIAKGATAATDCSKGLVYSKIKIIFMKEKNGICKESVF